MLLSAIAAGVLLIPSVLVMVCTIPIIALLSLPGLALLCYRRPESSSAKNGKSDMKQRRRAIITGGSSGIGLAVAEECIQQGFDEVILLARNVENLNKAKEQLKTQLIHNSNDIKNHQSTKTTKTTRIEAISVDISKPDELQKAASQIYQTDNNNKKEGKTGDDHEDRTFTCLFCVAGTAYPEYFSKLPATTFASLVQTNQLGTIYTVQAFLPHMTTGTILFTSSLAGQVGTFGFTAYSPTKFAIRGFAEALHMELVRRPISVCVAYPPDTDTPGFEKENLTKPIETKLISEEVALAKPKDIARPMVQEACKENPNFSLYFNVDAWMLSALTAGMGPVTSLFAVTSQVAGMGLFRVISLFYLKAWAAMIRQHGQNKAAMATADSIEKTKEDMADTTGK